MIFEAMIKDRRHEILEYLKENKFERVVDFGGAMDPWAAEYVTHYVDLQDPEKYHPGVIGSAKVIYGSLDDRTLWRALIGKHDKQFDFAICTQVLEHVLDPGVALTGMSMIAKEGFIGVPNKYVELRKKVHINRQEDLDACGLSDYFRGFIPHRWIITIRNNVIWFWPKLGFVEFLKLDWVDSNVLVNSGELCFRWKGEIPHKIVSDSDLGSPYLKIACEFYRTELKKGL